MLNHANQKHWCGLLPLLFSLFFPWFGLLWNCWAKIQGREEKSVCPCCPVLAPHIFMYVRALRGQLDWCLAGHSFPRMFHWVPPRAQGVCRRDKAHGFWAPCSQWATSALSSTGGGQYLKRGCSKIRPSALAFHLCSFSEAFSEPGLTSLGSGGAVTSYYRTAGKDGSFVASVLPLESCSDVLGT